MDIEAVAEKTPERIHTEFIDPVVGLQGYQVRKIARALQLDAPQTARLDGFLRGLYRLYVEKDASLAEINPLVVTKAGDLIALDAKLNFDDNALYRHKDLAELRDVDEEDPAEVRAQEAEIPNYIKLDGSIGCVVNGAGLAMATMDAIKIAGGEPANFLDIATVNDPARVVSSFRIITEDPNVKAILVNIVGGMARVDIIAKGIIDAHEQMDVRVPIVARLVGTNVEEGERLLTESGLDLIRATDLGEAAAKAVAAAS